MNKLLYDTVFGNLLPVFLRIVLLNLHFRLISRSQHTLAYRTNLGVMNINSSDLSLAAWS